MILIFHLISLKYCFVNYRILYIWNTDFDGGSRYRAHGGCDHQCQQGMLTSSRDLCAALLKVVNSTVGVNLDVDITYEVLENVVMYKYGTRCGTSNGLLLKNI